MRPPLVAVVALFVIVCFKAAYAAPQPFALINSTLISTEIDDFNSRPTSLSSSSGPTAEPLSSDNRPRSSSGPTTQNSSSGPTLSELNERRESSSGPTTLSSGSTSLSPDLDDRPPSTLSSTVVSSESSVSSEESQSSRSDLPEMRFDSALEKVSFGSSSSSRADVETLPVSSYSVSSSSQSSLAVNTEAKDDMKTTEATSSSSEDFIPSETQSSFPISTAVRNSVDSIRSTESSSSIGDDFSTSKSQNSAEVNTDVEDDVLNQRSTEAPRSTREDFEPRVSPHSSTMVTEFEGNIDSSSEDSSFLEKERETAGDSKDSVTVSRYVPPLDPVKHMLMMSETKDSKVSEQIQKSEAATTLSSSSIREETSSETASPKSETAASNESTDDFDKEAAESSEVEETHDAEEDIKDINSSTVIVRSTEILATLDSDNSKSDDSIENITSSSDAGETKEDLQNSKSRVETTSAVPTTTVDLPEDEEETSPNSELFKNSEVLKTDDLGNRETKSTEESTEVPTVISSTTEKVVKFEEAKDESVSEGSEDVIEEMVKKDGSSPVEKEIASESTEQENDSISEEQSTSTTSSSFLPVMTSEDSTKKLSTSQEERESSSMEEDLEFRSVKLPHNKSKVSYSDPEPFPSNDDDAADKTETTASQNEQETTISSILTTIHELLFPSTTTTEKPIESDGVKHAIVSSNQKTGAALSIDFSGISDVDSDTGADSGKDGSELLNAQSIKTGVDNISSSIKDSQPVTTTKSEEDSEEVSSHHSVKNAEIHKEPQESDSAVKDTTLGDFTTLTEIKEHELLDKQSDKTTLKESDAEVTQATTIEEKPVIFSDAEEVETSESSSETESDPSLDSKSSDYGLNIKDRYVSGNNTDMVAAVQFLHYHDKASSEQCFKLVDAHWNYATNLTDENKMKQLEQTLEYSLFHKEAWKNATSFAWKSFNDTLLRRWFRSLSVLGTAALPEEKLNEFNRLKAEMKNMYSTAKTCPYVSPKSAKRGQIQTEKDCRLTLEPDLQRILTKSRDYDELTFVWKAWRDAAGKPIREKYLRFINLSNEAARLNGFPDTGDMWREAYESDTFQQDLETLWEQLKPLYLQLHAYIRRKLIQEYGSDKIKDDGPIPAHLVGNMWAQSWVSLLDITQPFPGKPSVDVTPIMESKNITALEMFKISEEFFISLGLKPMPEEFWKHSLIEKPKDREIICHASAWDFCNGKDYRIKQCTDITMEDLVTVHHEMGHIQYFLQYARQPNVFREGANPGFHEAIGDVLALSVSTPAHLKSIGLLEDVADDPEGDLNFLLRTALDKISFLPSGYLIDLWRWGLFSGEIKPEEMNTKWWELRLKYQGICPPVKRTDTDFDPGAKYHVPGNVPYIRYFVSFVIQFQFHKVLCDAAGHTGPLYKCDIYRSKEAGQILSQVMELGSSEHWSEAMKIMTGGATSKMDAGPILEYFEPLIKFLEEQNQDEFIGWKSPDATICP